MPLVFNSYSEKTSEGLVRAGCIYVFSYNRTLVNKDALSADIQGPASLSWQDEQISKLDMPPTFVEKETSRRDPSRGVLSL